jgi:predicted lactoylglutathione lyase
MLVGGSLPQDIAERLGMSRRTPQRHVASIISKLTQSEAGQGRRHTSLLRSVKRLDRHREERRRTVALQVTVIMLGVEDMARSKGFYEGLGCTIDQDYPHFVSFNLGEGSSSLALYPREAAAQDAGVSSEGTGFRGVSFHYIVPSSDAVDEVMGNAEAAGGGVMKEAAATQWGYFGYFSDPDGYLWKVASAS